jgi:HK97 family phage portal protein
MADEDREPTQLEMFEKAFEYTEGLTLEDLAFQMGKDLGGVSINKVLQIAALMACCDVIAQDISKATLRLRERLPNGTSRIVVPSVRRDDIAEMLALEPNEMMTWREMISMMVYWSCFTDNALAGVIRNQDDTPNRIIPFQTGRVHMKVTGAEVFYDVTAQTLYDQALLGAPMRTFPARDMIHVRTRFIDGMEGYSTLDAGKSTIEGINAIKRFTKDLFSEDGQIRGVFSTDKEEPLPEPAFQRLRMQMKTLMSKFRQLTDPIVLEHGLKFLPMASKPNDLELAKQFEAAVNEVCRLFRMPPHKIFLMTGSKYENLETQEKMYVGDTLIPRAQPFEDQFAKVLLDRKGRLKYFFEFDRTEMTLRDTKLETDRIIRATERGILLIDEARAGMGANPLPNDAGQTRLVPVNMYLVDENNKVILGNQQTAKEQDPAADAATETDTAEDDASKSAPVFRVVK